MEASEIVEPSYRQVKIIVKLGNIVEEEVDGIVNPANTRLMMGGGVAKAIKEAGGLEIEREARHMAPVSLGSAVATKAGRLKAMYVIHSPTMSRPAMKTNLKAVSQAVKAALSAADKLRLRSLAFPGMGTGVGGVSPTAAAETMVDAIRNHVEAGSRLNEIRLLAFDKKLYAAFRDSVEKMCSRS